MVAVVAKVVVAASGASLLYGTTAPGGDAAFSAYNLILLTVLLGGVIAYVISQVRDYKPNRRLREDNADLRRDLNDAQARLDECNAEAAKLRRSRDFDQAIGDLRTELLKAIGDMKGQTT